MKIMRSVVISLAMIPAFRPSDSRAGSFQVRTFRSGRLSPVFQSRLTDSRLRPR